MSIKWKGFEAVKVWNCRSPGLREHNSPADNKERICRCVLFYACFKNHIMCSSQSQYIGCLFLHSGWPLCLGEKVVVQLSTLDWRLLRCNDFYLQVVPFSTRCPRLALKCLAPGGRTVQEILVPESQHPLVFTTEWLHSINKERGHKREGRNQRKE